MSPRRPRVLIAGAGVAGLETLLALRALAKDRVDVTIVAPELTFINRSMAVKQPFKQRRARGIRLEDAAAELDARWHRGAVDRVEHARHRVITKDGDALRYDMLVIAVGTRSEREWKSEGVLTYHGGGDAPSYRLLLHRLREGSVNRLAFVRPPAASWPLPLYDLALMTAADCAAHDRPQVDLSVITPEEQPLGIFGSPASAAIRRLLRERGVALYTSSYGIPSRRGWLDISPGERRLPVDAVRATFTAPTQRRPIMATTTGHGPATRSGRAASLNGADASAGPQGRVVDRSGVLRPRRERTGVLHSPRGCASDVRHKKARH